MHRLFWFFTLIQLGKTVEFTDRARLEIINGHLYIVGAEARNVTLAVSSSGYININGDDLRSVVTSAKLAAGKINSRNLQIANILDDLQKLQADREQINLRLTACETSLNSNNFSLDILSSIPETSYSWGYLKARIDKIERDLGKNECKPNPCRNGGVCTDLYLKFSCQCLDGWTGTRCTKDVNECAQFIGTDLGCQNGATCINTKGSYQCICPAGYYGRHCLRRTNDCTSGSSSELCDHGTCVTQAKGTQGFVCICDQGWATDGTNPACSVDVDECKVSPCSRSPSVSCINVPGSFYCGSCPIGYTGDGFKCDDVNECAINNGGCSTMPLVSCINTEGSSKCGPCPPGYVGDGTNCVFVGLCAANNGGCHPQAVCQEIGTNVRCVCQTGYSGSGIGPFGCVPSNQPSIGANPCASNPCVNGRCVATGSYTFNCRCIAGFYGPLCNDSRNVCDTMPCANGGTCIPKFRGFTCRCTKNWMGPLCREEKQFCGGWFRASEGVLEFPNSVSAKYQSDLSCAWRIEVNSSKVINVTFDNFDLEPGLGRDCPYDWLQIYDGNDVGSHNMIGKFCGKTLPNNGNFLSTNHELYLWFKSDRSSNHMGFKFHWNSVDPVCGGELNARIHGTFHSPGAPGNYPKNRDCEWTILTTPGQRITFNFYQVNLENHQNCSFDYVEFFDGLSSNDPSLAKYCSNLIPPPLVTTGNVALIHFHSDGISSDKGFLISYNPTPGIPGCGGIFSDPSGEIRSLNINGKYKNNLDCAWIIRLGRDFRVKLEFTTFEIEHSTTCRHDFLEIRQGASEASPLMGKFCGSELPPNIESESNSLYVRFRTDSYLSYGGFVIKYTSVCGGRYLDSSGVIKSPGYPSLYQHNLECIYIIEQPPGKAIRLEFQEFELEYMYSSERSESICLLDYVKIVDGMDDKIGRQIGQYCTQPPVIYSTQNFLWLKLKTDHSIAKQGFYANYSSIDTTCGGVYITPSGTISSPRHPDKYPPGIMCTWIIIGAPGNVIELTFVSFQMEEKSIGECRFDYLAVYNDAKTENLMGKFCGNIKPPVLTSGSNIVSLVMKTDQSLASEGFQIQYSTINATKLCGGNFFMSSGVLKSPYYPKNYPNHKICSWVIRVANGQKISLTFNDFEMEGGRGNLCPYDRLEIRNGGTDTSPLIGSYCGDNKPPPITSFSNTLFLKMTTDAFTSNQGFEAQWHSSLSGCGGTLTGISGYISSPNYPEPYGNFAECDYKILVATGNKIKLHFFDMELEESTNCTVDFVQIYDGIDFKAKSLGVYCNSNKNPGTITSSSNKLLIRFRSDAAIEGKGFLLKYTIECNVEVNNQYSGVIESPGYPDPISESYDCLWTISVLPGNKLNYSFSDFKFRLGACDDYIEIKEGSLHEDNPSNQLGKYCGTNNPPVIAGSALPKIFIKFIATGQSSSSFRLEWVQNGCGGKLTREVGEFSSPNYPFSYPNDIECIWTIAVGLNNSVSLHFYILDLEMSTNCTLDSVKVYDGPDITSPLLTNICAMQKSETTLMSQTNFMTVHFDSDGSRFGRGFRAAYYSSPAVCGGLFTAIRGNIRSKGYPLNYSPNTNCVWTIRVDEKHRVNLTFIDFDLYNDNTNNSEICSNTYVEVFDGELLGKSLFKYCKNQLPHDKTIISTSNIMTIYMKSGNTQGAKGFLAAYQMTCGAVIYADEPGSITYNIGLHSLDEISNCTWKIVAPQSDGHITLTINLLDIVNYQDYSEGTQNLLEIFDGPDENSTLIGAYSSSQHPPAMISTGNAIFVRFSPKWPLNIQLEMSYSALSSACGGDLSGLRGSLASPGYPGSNPKSFECVWTIASSPGNALQLNWKEFDIPNSLYCNINYVEVREGTAQGRLIGVYCGASLPPMAQLKGAWIKFKSENNQFGSTLRFLAEYATVLNNELTGLNGSIANPLYPNYFTQQLQVKWRITVPLGFRIRITFDDLAVESQLNDGSCLSELTIFDGYDETGGGRTSVCGSVKPEAITSSSNVVLVLLNSNILLHLGSKFRLVWEGVKVDKKPLINRPECYEEYVLNPQNSTVEIKSRNYPQPYPKSLTCTWQIRTPPGFHLAFKINHLDIFQTQGCLFENLAFYNNDGQLIGKYCKPNETIFNENLGSDLKVQFNSSVFPPKTGFSLLIDLVAGGEIQAPNGVIDFTWNGTVYRPWSQSKRSREWTIRVGRGRKIAVTFERFDISADVDGHCSDKYLMLRNGYHSDSPLLGRGKYCGSLPKSIPLTTSDELYVKLFSSFKVSSFRLRFEEIGALCGGQYVFDDNFSQKTINSPNYPNIPPPKIECIWKIRAPLGRTLQIDFIKRFDLSWSHDCDKEYVEVRNGGSILADSLGRFCSSAPSTIRTDDNMMFVKYFTNITDPKNGFMAQVSISRCGGTIREESGEITSPGYPLLPSEPLNCSWTIYSTRFSKIVANFEDFDLPLVPYTRKLQPSYQDFAQWRRLLLMRKLTNCSFNDNVLLVENVPPNLVSPTEFSFTVSTFRLEKFIERSTLFGEESVIGFYCNATPPSTNAITTAGDTLNVIFKRNEKLTERHRGFKLTFKSTTTECGGFLNTPSGTITSPHYPREMPQPYYCEWALQVPLGKRITLKIDDFDLSGTHMEQRVNLYEDSIFTSRIAIISNTNRPLPEYKSLGNTMVIFYYATAFSGGVHRGFKFSYSSDDAAECGGMVNSTEGIILPPQNKTSYKCNWIFPRRWGTNLTLTFTLEEARLGNRTWACSRSTSAGVLFLANNYDSIDTFSKEFCGNVSDKKIRSPYTDMTVTAVQGIYYGIVNFRLKYKLSSCGGLIKSSQFPYKLTSPNFPQSYPTNIDCAWIVEAATGETIKVTFVSFDLEPSCGDFLSIRNGGNPSSPLIDHFCGKTNPNVRLVSEREVLFLEFQSDSSNSAGGFEILLETNHTECGGIFHGETSVISSPNFPFEYGPNMECEWVIISDVGTHIGLIFEQRFHLEESLGCVNDFVKIFEYTESHDWRLIATFCGRLIPNPVNSTSSLMKILFRSNQYIQGDGFFARWQRNCGAIIDSVSSGTITSPGYPNHYSGPLHCEYLFKTDGQLININFTYFNLEPDMNINCMYDSLEIQEEASNTLGTKYCGTKAPTSLSFQRNFKITFIADSFANYGGFVFNFWKDACGGFINTSTVIQFALGSNRLPKGCTWNIEAPTNMIVSLRFGDVKLPSFDNCDLISLIVFDVSSNATLATLCGKLSNLASFVSSSNKLALRLIKERKTYSKAYAFTAYVTFTYGPSTGCGGFIRIGSNPVNLVSPDVNKDDRYEEFLECQWLVTAPESNYVIANIVSMDIDSCNATGSCSCDYLEFRDGNGPASDLILKTCGTNLTQIVSSDNKMWIRFVSDGAYSGNGFKISLSSRLSSCGFGRYNATTDVQTLTSPHYSTRHVSGTRCSWLITPSPIPGDTIWQSKSRLIHIRIVDLDIDYSDDCTRDFLAITDYNNQAMIVDKTKGLEFDDVGDKGKIFRGKNLINSLYMAQKSPTGLTKYCGNGQNIDFYGSGGAVEIIFFSSSVNARGFKIEYSLSSCGRNYTDGQGRIRTLKFTEKTHCYIKIQAPQANQTISLYFFSFLLPLFNNCSTFFEIRDGDSSTSPLINKICGFSLPNPIFSTSNAVWIHMYTEKSSYEDIDITYTTTDQGRGCGGYIYNYGGVFTSPLYPENVRNNSICRWDVVVPVGLLIVFKFSVFDIGPSSTCTTDFVEFLEYTDDITELRSLYTFCGRDNPAPIRGSGNKMVVKYTRSVHNGGTGWRLLFAGLAPGVDINYW